MSKTQVKSNDRFSKFRMESPLGKFFTILLYVVMTIIVLIVLLPVLHIIAASFSDPQAMISGKVSFWPKDFTLRGYEAVFTYKKFWTGFRNSLFYMVFGTFINIVMTLLCAYPLSRKEFTARNKVAMFFVFTMYFSGGMVPSFMLVNALGLVDTIWAMLIPGAMSTYNMIIARTYMINSIPDELYEAAKKLEVPYDLVQYVHENHRLPVVNFAAGGVATPADAALMMQLGAEGVFVGSGIFKSGDPAKRAAAIVQATTNYNDADLVAKLSEGLGEAMVGINEQEIAILMAERGK